VWTELSIPSFIALTWNGKPAPSRFLHKQLDVTVSDGFIDSPAYLEYAAATHEVFVDEASRRSPHNFTDLVQLNSLSQ
jgi:hypothetical protein